MLRCIVGFIDDAPSVFHCIAKPTRINGIWRLKKSKASISIFNVAAFFESNVCPSCQYLWIYSIYLEMMKISSKTSFYLISNIPTKNKSIAPFNINCIKTCEVLLGFLDNVPIYESLDCNLHQCSNSCYPNREKWLHKRSSHTEATNNKLGHGYRLWNQW